MVRTRSFPSLPSLASLAAAALAVALVGACGEDLPASPTYVDDVRAILQASCTRCHGAPTCIADVPTDFRLDHWSGADGVRGVSLQADRIAVRAVDEGTMPLAGSLSGGDREILRRWQRAGSPRGVPVDPHPPTIALTAALPGSEPAGGKLPLAVDVADADGDDVTWTLLWKRTGASGVDGVLAAALEGGRATVDVDLGVLVAGSYQLVARLRDDTGDRAVEVPLGDPITIGDRPAAPSVRLLAPTGELRLHHRDPLDARWQADDADSPGALTASVGLRGADDRVITLAADLDARAGAASLPLADVPAGRYRVEVTISDGAIARTQTSPCGLTVRD
jgi:hypothetical protein